MRFKLRDKSSPDAFEKFLIGKTEWMVDTAFTWLMILKLVRNKPMCGMEIRRALTSKGLNTPHKTTLYTTLKMLKTMKMVEATNPIITERGKQKPYRATEKGKKILDRATKHLKTRMTLLYLV